MVKRVQRTFVRETEVGNYPCSAVFAGMQHYRVMEVCTDVQKDSGIRQHAAGSDSLKAGPEKPLYKAVKVKPKIWQWSPHNVGNLTNIVYLFRKAEGIK